VLSRVFTLHISCERIASYLSAPELHNLTTTQGTTTLRDVTSTWHFAGDVIDSPPTFHLRDISISFSPGGLNIVAGGLGSGKSALLLTILGETKVIRGEIVASRSNPQLLPALGSRETDLELDERIKAAWLQPGIAYTPQVAYIEHGTVRSNICFGQLFWKDRYQDVLRACCLEEDIASWPDGDKTELGEGGYVISGECGGLQHMNRLVTCSAGGQQSRINLARSLYSRAQTLLIDDPLSAVDNATARHLVANALAGPLVLHRTIILATHNVALCLRAAKQVAILKEGRIAEVLDLMQPEAEGSRISELTSLGIAGGDQDTTEPRLAKELLGSRPLAVRQLIKAEKRETGLTGRKNLRSLLRTAGGLEIWVPVIAIALMNDVLGISQNALLARWSAHIPPHTDIYFAAGSISITIAKGLGLFAFSAVLIYAFTWRASGLVHGKLFGALLRAPLQVLQAIPTGRILNRFTEDMERFDMDLADITHKTIKMGVSITVILGFTLKEVPTLSWVLLALVPLFYRLQWRLAKFLSDAKKLNSIWSSPMLTMVNDSEHAVTIIRAFGAVGTFTRRMRALQTQKRIAGMTEFAAWLLCRSVYIPRYFTYASLIGNICPFTSCCLQGAGLCIPAATGIAILHHPEKSAGWAGYTLAIIQFVTEAIYELIMQIGQIDVALVTVERLEECKSLSATHSLVVLSFQIDSQLPSEIESKSPTAVPAHWPSSGHIRIEELSAGYDADLPDVLHDVRLEILPSERIGVVGRT
jgi:ABC-type multidrug transport system fused ATPase/permease subunit